jgi:RNA polymerase sigma-70 factor (ECF subfamily)
MLSRFENMSYVEIAETMGLSTKAVKSLLSRARVNLRDLLQPYIDAGLIPHEIEKSDFDFREDQESESNE